MADVSMASNNLFFQVLGTFLIKSNIYSKQTTKHRKWILG